jgi:hypothetical protein
MRAVLRHLCSVASLVGLAAAGIPAAHAAGGPATAMKITTDDASIPAAKALYDRIVASAKKHS